MSDNDRYLQKRNAKLDNLLRKVKRLGGVEFLSEEEKQFLNRCAAEIRIESGVLRVMTSDPKPVEIVEPTGP